MVLCLPPASSSKFFKPGYNNTTQPAQEFSNNNLPAPGSNSVSNKKPPALPQPEATPATTTIAQPTNSPLPPAQIPSTTASPKKRKAEDEASPKPTKRNRHINTVRYRCRFGCDVRDGLIGGQELRLHMYKEHQLFEDGCNVKRCSFCGERFGRNTEFKKHLNTTWICERKFDPTKKAYGHPQPRTKEERADTWAHSEDGPVLNKLIVGRENEEGRGDRPTPKRQDSGVTILDSQQHAITADDFAAFASTFEFIDRQVASGTFIPVTKEV